MLFRTGATTFLFLFLRISATISLLTDKEWNPEKTFANCTADGSCDENCIMLPPPENKPEPEDDFFETRRKGLEQIRNYTTTDYGILIVGNTGAGKSTVTQIIAGNLSTLYSVCSSACNYVIVDENEKIGLPSTKSKTLVPDLVLKSKAGPNGTDLPFYDYPGFEDTRGPHLDLAANIFMNRVARKPRHVKLLAVVPFNAVKNGGGDRISYDKMAGHVTTLISDISKYNKSVGLIVNMVDKYRNGRNFSDTAVINSLTDFLQQYMTENECSNPTDSTTARKCYLTSIFLAQNTANNVYEKIWFVRTPDVCGSLETINDMIYARSNISRLTDMLEFTKVNATADLGFALSDAAKNFTKNYTNPINEQVSVVVETLTSNLLVHYNLTIQQDMDWFKIDLNERLDYYSQTLANIKDLANAASKAATPYDLLRIIRKYFTLFNHNISHKFTLFMEEQNAMLAIFSEATGKPEGDPDSWSKPLTKFSDTFSRVGSWFDYTLTLQEKIQSYDFQKTKPKLPKDNVDTVWIDYINDNIYPVPPLIKNVSAEINGTGKMFGQMITFTLENATIECNNSSLFIKQNYFIMSELQGILADNYCGQQINQITISAGHTVFFDQNMHLFYDVDLAIVSPYWFFVQTSTLSIQLNGSLAQTFPQANSGAIGSGSNGADGCKGRTGRQGGSLLGITLKVLEGSEIHVISSPSHGGAGQRGGNGGSGKVRDATSNDKYHDQCCVMDNGRPYCYDDHWGFDGGDGGNGGRGGIGGEAAHIGMFGNFYQFQSAVEFHFLETSSQKGANGDGGNAGAAGRIGYGYECSGGNCFAVEGCCGRKAGIAGASGAAGVSTQRCETPPNHREMVTYEEIIKYRIAHFNNSNILIRDLLEQIDNSDETRSIWNLKSLANEAVALETLDRNKYSTSLLVSLYASLIKRLELLSQQTSLSLEHQKVLGILLTSSYSIMMNLSGPRGYGIIVDVYAYLTLAKQKIEGLKINSAYQSIQTDKGILTNQLRERIAQCLWFIENVANPAIDTAQSDIDLAQRHLEERIRTSVYDATLSLEDVRNQLVDANRELRSLEHIEIFGFIGNALWSIIPGVPSIDGLFDKIKDEIAEQKDLIERLEEMRDEANKLLSDLKEKQTYFIAEFKPLVSPLLQYFRNVTNQLANSQHVQKSELIVSTGQLKEKLTECTNRMEPLKDLSRDSSALVQALEKLMDSMTMSIDLYELIDQYTESQQLAEYIANVTSATLDPIPITDPEYKPIVSEYENRVILNMLTLEVSRALSAFKQWVFPFAKLYIPPETTLTEEISILTHNEPQNLDHLRQVELLVEDLQRYKASTVGGQDTYIRLTNFSSGFLTSRPFYTWSNANYSVEVAKFLSGDNIDLYADVRKYGMFGRDAIKFKLVEVNLILVNVTREEQAEFDELLNYFGVSLTHTGVSNFRFLEKYYAMNGLDQTMLYNFERDSRGNRLGTNMIYEKFKAGDLMLSPYTHWSMQLSVQTPMTIPLEKQRKNVSFADIDKFTPYVQIELVGVGTYVDSPKFLQSGDDLSVEEYYEEDTRPVVQFELP